MSSTMLSPAWRPTSTWTSWRSWWRCLTPVGTSPTNLWQFGLASVGSCHNPRWESIKQLSTLKYSCSGSLLLICQAHLNFRETYLVQFTQLDTDCLCIPEFCTKLKTWTLVNKKNIELWRIIDINDAVHLYIYRAIFYWSRDYYDAKNSFPV